VASFHLHLHLRDVKQLDELLIQRTPFRVREATILDADGRMAPVLNLAQAADQAARSVLALVAVNENGVRAHIQQNSERLRDDIFGNIDERLLVAGHAKLVELDAILDEKSIVSLRVLL